MSYDDGDQDYYDSCSKSEFGTVPSICLFMILPIILLVMIGMLCGLAGY